jgi:hypothetical protein
VRRLEQLRAGELATVAGEKRIDGGLVVRPELECDDDHRAALRRMAGHAGDGGWSLGRAMELAHQDDGTRPHDLCGVAHRRPTIEHELGTLSPVVPIGQS